MVMSMKTLIGYTWSWWNRSATLLPLLVIAATAEQWQYIRDVLLWARHTVAVQYSMKHQ